MQLQARNLAESFNLAASNALFLIEPFSLQFSESCAVVAVQKDLLLAYNYMVCYLLIITWHQQEGPENL